MGSASDNVKLITSGRFDIHRGSYIPHVPTTDILRPAAITPHLWVAFEKRIRAVHSYKNGDGHARQIILPDANTSLAIHPNQDHLAFFHKNHVSIIHPKALPTQTFSAKAYARSVHKITAVDSNTLYLGTRWFRPQNHSSASSAQYQSIAIPNPCQCRHTLAHKFS